MIDIPFRGPLGALSPKILENRKKIRREGGLSEPLREILRRVLLGGDRACLELVEKFDRVKIDSLEVPPDRVRRAPQEIPDDLRTALESASQRIERWARALLPQAVEIELGRGIRAGRLVVPVEKAGIYVPGGRASYPSTLLMGVIPAKVAGVREVIVLTPPGRGGIPPPSVLAAAAIGGADRVFSLGGPAAIFAMAWGTESIPRCDVVAGPGSRRVEEAKRFVSSFVRTDSPAGPTELLAIHDGETPLDPDSVALELAAQSEHDPWAQVLFVSTNPRTLESVAQALGRIPRGEWSSSFSTQGGILQACSLEEALEFSDDYAPEHLWILSSRAREILPRVRNFGSALLGPSTSVVFEDYGAGPDHILPTGGYARSRSGLSVLDFLKFPTYLEVSKEARRELGRILSPLPLAEGLRLHKEVCQGGGE